MIKQVGNVQLMQKMNRLKVLNYIREKGVAFRPEIAKATGLSLSSVTNVVSYLITKNIIESDSGFIKSTVGRRADVLKFSTFAYNLVCVLVEHGTMSVSFCDLAGNVIEKSVKDAGAASGEELVEDIVEGVNEMIEKHRDNKILAVGIALSALVLKDEIYSAPLNLHIPLFKENLSEKIGLPVFVENITNAKAVWQFKGKEKTEGNVLFLDLDEGIGAVQLINGNINRSAAGEIGHTCVEAEGEKCVCGNFGCLETISSYDKILNLAKEHGFENVSEAEKSADATLRNNVFAKCIKYLGIGISNLVTLFNPDQICINYGSFKNCPKVIDSAVGEMFGRTYEIFTKNLSIKYVDITSDEVIKGVTLYMCDIIFSLDFEHGIIE